MNLLTKQSIHIDIDGQGSYSIDFLGCKLTDAYVVLKTIVTGMETGEFFDDGLDITDADGNPVTREELRLLIAGINEEISSGETPEGGSSAN